MLSTLIGNLLNLRGGGKPGSAMPSIAVIEALRLWVTIRLVEKGDS
jgi:hypothetical protein